jgi:hypothetical protein
MGNDLTSMKQYHTPTAPGQQTTQTTPNFPCRDKGLYDLLLIWNFSSFSFFPTNFLFASPNLLRK